jgi:hypothetical protein
LVFALTACAYVSSCGSRENARKLELERRIDSQLVRGAKLDDIRAFASSVGLSLVPLGEPTETQRLRCPAYALALYEVQSGFASAVRVLWTIEVDSRGLIANVSKRREVVSQ